MRVLVFGASTVQGYWDSEGGWVARLKKYYDAIHIKDLSSDTPNVMNLGVSGDGSAELLKRIDAETRARVNAKGQSILISIGSGSAAIFNNEPVATIEQFENDMRQIVSIAKRYTNKIILIGSPAVDESKTTPVAWADLHFRNERIAEFEAAVEKLASEQGLPFVGIHSKMLKNLKYLVCADGLHPNNQGHQLIFELVQPELDRLLN